MNRTARYPMKADMPLGLFTGALRGGVPLKWGLVKTRLRAAAEPRGKGRDWEKP